VAGILARMAAGGAEGGFKAFEENAEERITADIATEKANALERKQLNIQRLMQLHENEYQKRGFTQQDKLAKAAGILDKELAKIKNKGKTGTTKELKEQYERNVQAFAQQFGGEGSYNSDSKTASFNINAENFSQIKEAAKSYGINLMSKAGEPISPSGWLKWFKEGKESIDVQTMPYNTKAFKADDSSGLDGLLDEIKNLGNSKIESDVIDEKKSDTSQPDTNSEGNSENEYFKKDRVGFKDVGQKAVGILKDAAAKDTGGQINIPVGEEQKFLSDASVEEIKNQLINAGKAEINNQKKIILGKVKANAELTKRERKIYEALKLIDAEG